MKKNYRLPSLDTISPIVPRYQDGEYTVVKLESTFTDKQAVLTMMLLEDEKGSEKYNKHLAELVEMENISKIRYDLSPSVTDAVRKNPAPKVYVYKVYDDEYAYGEESIQVFGSKDKAIAELKKDVSEYYKMPFEDIPSNEDIFDKNDDNFSEDYVSILDGDHCLFWIIEEHEVA